MAKSEFDKHIFKSKTLELAPGVAQEAIDFLNKQKCYSLPIPSEFNGAGVYAVYYRGEFPLYAPISEPNKDDCVLPIYIGKADPPGGRTGKTSKKYAETGEHKSLYERIMDHYESIQAAATTIKADDFRCRFIIAEGKERDFIGTIEKALISHFHPLWNGLSFAFSNHHVGRRFDQKRPKYDTLHPGRPWATNMSDVKPIELIEAEVKKYYIKYKLIPDDATPPQPRKASLKAKQSRPKPEHQT